MKTIGLIGGMSWESTALYYQAINREIAARKGGLHSAKLVLASVDFAEIGEKQKSGEWDALAAQLADLAKKLCSAGADCILICTNTMHKIAPQVQAAVDVPLIHIATPTITAIEAAGLNTVGLLGTKFTMSQRFMHERYADNGVRCLVPDEGMQNEVHRIIFDELCQGEVSDSSRVTLIAACEALRKQGAQGIILGCTELTLSVKPQHIAQPLFDTTALHAQAAVDFALSKI
jgi:aspartate racemase